MNLQGLACFSTIQTVVVNGIIKGVLRDKKKPPAKLHSSLLPHRVTMGADELSIQGPSEIAHLTTACVLGVGRGTPPKG